MLAKEQIRQLIEEKELIRNAIDIEKQLTPNGFDLTVEKIFKFTSYGAIDFSNQERQLPQTQELLLQKKSPQDRLGWWILSAGIYKVRTNEVITVPLDTIAFAFTRTTLLRMGAFTQNGVWDAGFSGKSEFSLIVQNHHGIRIKQNARLVQLVFFSGQETEAYNGIYNNLT